MYGQIYKITNIINQKIYVGQTRKTLQERFNSHVEYSEFGATTKLANAIRKYGKENFTIEQLDTADSKPELNTKEIEWISKLNSFANGYNMTIGGEGGDTYCKRTTKQMIETRKKLYNYWKFHNPNHGQLVGERNGMYGKKHTQEVKDKISKKLKGRKKPSDHGAKVSAALKGKAKNYYPPCKYLYIYDTETNTEQKQSVKYITKRFSVTSTILKKFVENNMLFENRYYVKCVSTICDECNRVGSEISTESKQGAVK